MCFPDEMIVKMIDFRLDPTTEDDHWKMMAGRKSVGANIRFTDNYICLLSKRNPHYTWMEFLSDTEIINTLSNSIILCVAILPDKKMVCQGKHKVNYHKRFARYTRELFNIHSHICIIQHLRNFLRYLHIYTYKTRDNINLCLFIIILMVN